MRHRPYLHLYRLVMGVDMSKTSLWLTIHYCMVFSFAISYHLAHASLLTDTSSSKASAECPRQCMCLSPFQVLCNGGGWTEVPAGLPTTVEHLSLTKNNLRELRSDAFAQWKQLRKLYLDGNSIVNLKPFAFRGLPRLQELSLQNTPLERLPQFAFAGLHNVTHIYLSHNQICKIEAYAFAGTSALQMLLLTHNPVVKIETFAFSGLSEVQLLYLPAGIKTIETDAFNGLTSIGHLKLAHMDLQTLKPYTFRNLRNVQVLTIQESDLGVLKAEAFSGLSNVGEICILNNKIDAIEELRITSINKVNTLKITGNHFLEIPPSYTIVLEGIQQLIVTNNHFPCDCRLHWLLQTSLALQNGSTDDFMTHNFCISPFEFHGRAIVDMDAELWGTCPEPKNPRLLLSNQEGAAAVREKNGIPSSASQVVATAPFMFKLWVSLLFILSM